MTDSSHVSSAMYWTKDTKLSCNHADEGQSVAQAAQSPALAFRAAAASRLTIMLSGLFKPPRESL